MRLLRPSLCTALVVALASCSGGRDTNLRPAIVIETSLGKVEVELDPAAAPLTTENFLAYVDDSHFDGTAFHRVIPGFMVQGGGFAAESGMLIQKDTRTPIKNEAKSAGISNVRGTIAMARTNDPHSATAQFFINLTDNSAKLDPGGFTVDGYTAFGVVTTGIDIVDQIAAVQTKNRTLVSLAENGNQIASTGQDVPAEDVLIKSIRRIER